MTGKDDLIYAITKDYDSWDADDDDLMGAGADRILDLENELKYAHNRIRDMLMGDDGQAWKEARKYLEQVEKQR